jgi:hypothetical protein
METISEYIVDTISSYILTTISEYILNTISSLILVTTYNYELITISSLVLFETQIYDTITISMCILSSISEYIIVTISEIIETINYTYLIQTLSSLILVPTYNYEIITISNYILNTYNKYIYDEIKEYKIIYMDISYIIFQVITLSNYILNYTDISYSITNIITISQNILIFKDISSNTSIINSISHIITNTISSFIITTISENILITVSNYIIRTISEYILITISSLILVPIYNYELITISSLVLIYTDYYKLITLSNYVLNLYYEYDYYEIEKYNIIYSDISYLVITTNTISNNIVITLSNLIINTISEYVLYTISDYVQIYYKEYYILTISTYITNYTLIEYITLSDIYKNNYKIELINYISNNYYIENRYTSGNILPKLLTPIFNIQNKIYDTTYNISISGYTLSGIIFNEFVDLSDNFTYYLTNYNTGMQLIIFNNLTLIGNNLYNYVLSISTFIYIDIKPSIIYGSFVMNNKIYDGNNSANVNSYLLFGNFYNNDSSNIFISSLSAHFIDYNVNDNILININNIILSTTNNKLLNYKINNLTSFANIYKRNITAYGINKMYDSTVSVDISFSNIVNNDFIEYNAIFNSKDVGYNEINISQIYNDNYSLLNFLTYANIFPYLLSINFYGTKVYDKTPFIKLNYTISGIFISDSNNVSIYNNFISILRNVNAGYQLADISNIKITNNNYIVNDKKIESVLITPLILSTYSTKIYDNTFIGYFTISGGISGDIINYFNSGICDISKVGFSRLLI